MTEQLFSIYKGTRLSLNPIQQMYWIQAQVHHAQKDKRLKV